MSVSRSDIEKIAELARLRLEEHTLAEVTQSITDILALVDQMQAIDTHAVEPMANPRDATQRLRADSVTEPNQRGAFLEIAPAVEDGLFLVPKVIE